MIDRTGVRGTEMSPTSAVQTAQAFENLPWDEFTQTVTQHLSFTCAVGMLSITGLMLLVVLTGGVCQAHRRLLGRRRRDEHSWTILES